jgi:hypothetical protein
LANQTLAQFQNEGNERIDMRRLALTHGHALCFALSIVGSWSASAHAQSTGNAIPPGCQGARESRAFNAGTVSGHSLVRQAWANVNDCDQIETFETIITDDLSGYQVPPGSSSYTICRFTGIVAGMLDELDAQFQNCQDQCLAEGETAGNISAIAYCQLSIALGGLATADWFLRGPVQVCGLNFQVGCDSSFVGDTENYSNSHGACLPYTQNPFTAVWTQARNNQCAYNPIPPNQNTGNEHAQTP